jgi:hypothetical protein
MTYTFRTLIVPANLGALAIKITDAIGGEHRGMFIAQVAEGAPPAIGQPDTRTPIGYISTGALPTDSPMLADAATLHTACEADPTITLADCQNLLRILDLTQDEPHERQNAIIEETKTAAVAVPWVQPTGAHDAYAKGAAATYGGKTWVSLIEANVWAPGVSGWRESWGQASVGYPAWVQPTGAHDAYPVNAMVRHNGKNWRSTVASNVWAPGVYGWVEI